MKKKILITALLVSVFFMCISLLLNNNTYSIYRETLNTKVYLSVINSGEQIKIEFDAQGGTSVDDVYREFNQEIGALPTTTKEGYNFIGWYTLPDGQGGTKIKPDDRVISSTKYYAHWAKLVCIKAQEGTLHEETCDTNGGCTKIKDSAGELIYTVGDKITYGTLAGETLPTKGNAYDCDVNNDGVYNPLTERFYYVRANVGESVENAVLVHYTSFDAAGQMDSSSSRDNYEYDAGKAYLPDSTVWSNPALVTFDTKVSRYINHTDIEEACGSPIAYNSASYFSSCQYFLENSRFQAKAKGRAGIWVDKLPDSDTLYRIQTETPSIQIPDKVTSANTVRPVIEIPFNTIDGFKERASFNVTFDSVGGSHIPSEARYDGQEIGPLPTPTKDGLTFGGWYTDTTYQTQVTAETLITATTTFYAKWIKTYDDLEYVFYIPGKCTFGGSSTNITSTTSDCISTINPTNSPIDYTSTSKKYIDTGVKLYSETNKYKDYEIGFTIENFDPTIQVRQATLMNTKLEGNSYPGLVFRRYDDTTSLDLSSRKTSTNNVQLQIPSEGVEHIRIYRIYNEETEVQEIFYSINNGEKIKVNDLSEFNPTFDTNVWFGATPTNTTANVAQRHYNGTLSNLYIKLKTDSITKSKVTFNAHGGTADYAEKEVQQGATVGDLPTATKSGYAFDGWYTAETNGTKITTNTVVIADITYHAHWKEKFIVSFDGNAEDATVSQASFEVVDGESLGSENIPTATREGYEFVGWFTDPENGTQIDGTEAITQQTEYYAHWTELSTTATVTYDLSSDNMNTWSVKYNEEYEISYDSSTKMSTVSVTGHSGNWEIFYIELSTVANREYTLTFDYQNPYGYQVYGSYGGIGVQALKTTPRNDDNASSSYQITRINLPSAQNATTVSKELTFTATGTTTYIAINFGMAADNATSTILLGNFKLVETLNKGDTLDTSVTSIAKSGYTFNGYYTAPSGGTQITSLTSVPNTDTTYYARWSRLATNFIRTANPINNVYTGTNVTPPIVVIDSGKTLALTTDYTVSYSNNIDIGTATATITTVERYDEDTQSYRSGSTTTTYYINNAQLTFDKGNCSGVSGSSTLYTKKDATKVYTGLRTTTEGTIPSGVKLGFEFEGWYDASSNGNKVLNADGTFTGTAVVNYTNATSWQTVENQTLYANCESVDGYIVTANANGGSITETTGWTGTGSTAIKAIPSDEPYGTLPNISKTGYTLQGWSILPEGYTQVEYIASTGSQYINTGAQIFNNDSHEIIIDFEPTRLYSYNQLFGSTYDSNSFEAWIYSDGDLSARYNYTKYADYKELSVNTRYLVSFIKDGGNLYEYVDGVLISGSSSGVTTASTTSPLILFKSGSDYSEYKLYGANIYSNGVMIRNYIPCIKDSTGEAGLYDLVNNEFYGNDGSGSDFSTGNPTYITSQTDLKILGNHNIYAKWAPSTYTLTANANGGSISSTSGWTGTGNVATKQVTYTQPYGTLPNASKANAALVGWSLLPDEYFPVEYIESTGTQYIDLDYYATKDTGIYADFKYNSTPDQARLFGVDTSNSGNSNISYSFYINGSYKWAYSYKDGTGNWVTTNISADTNRHQLYLNIDGTVKLDNSYNEDISGTITNTATSSMPLFALHNGKNISRYSSARIYSFKIYEAGELVRDYIPCINNTTGEVGLYELVNGVFYDNDGTGSFNVGNRYYITDITTVDIIGNHTIYAKWVDSITVTADANGGTIPTTTGWTGTGETATKTIAQNGVYGTLPTPTREGYTFQGWYTDQATQVEYIESDGSQYIVSDTIPIDTTGFHIEASTANIQADYVYIGGKKDSSNTRFMIGTTGGQVEYGWNTLGHVYNVTANQINTFEMNYLNSREIVINNDTYVSDLGTLTSHTRPIYIFAYNLYGNLSYQAQIKLYDLKISEGSHIVHAYVPCINNATNKAGLCDTVSDTFLGEANNGTFATGNNIGTILLNNITSESIANSSHRIYAKWHSESTNYTITYGLNNGIVSNPTQYNANSETITLNNPTKTLVFKGNYNATSGANASTTDNITIGNDTTQAQTFAGWTGSNGISPETTVTIPTGSTGNRSYTAHWTAVAGTLPTVTKSGYTCGWSTSSTGTTIEYESGGTYPASEITEDMVATVNLYAVCTLNTYTLTADATGGAIETTTGWTGSGNTATKQLSYGEAFGTLPTVSRNDYTFDGWSLLPNGYTQIEYTESTWTQYIDTNYKVTKDTGIEVTYQFSSTTTQQRVFGVQDTSASGITFEFYINNGGTWAYASKDGGGQWNSTGITADTNKHTLKFNVDKGYYFISNTSMTQNAQFDQVPTLSSSNLNLYLFAENDVGNLYRLSAPKIYEFKIYENKNLVRYMIPAIQDSTGKVGLYDIIDDIFYGNAATTGNDFTAGNTTYVTSATILTEKMDYTIYAKWSSNATTYNITYAMNNGINNSNNPSTYTNIGSDITLSDPTKTLTFKGNYNATSGANAASGSGVTIGSDTTKAQTFAGWTGSNGDTAQTTVTIASGSTGDKSYTAHWTAVAGTLPTVTRTGYTCGWSTSSSGTTITYASGASFPTSAISEDMSSTVNLYAVCIQNDYAAMIGEVGYSTVQEAINAVPTNGSTATTVKVMKDLTNQVATGNVPFATVEGGRKVYLDLQGYTISVLSTNKPKTVYITNGTLEVVNGTITTASEQGTIETTANGTLKVSNATIANTSAKAQAIFNNGGTVYIQDGAVISNQTVATGNSRRAAVHNYGAGSKTYITGGTITSTNFAGVYNERGTLVIGTQGGGISTTSPVIQGKTYGVTAASAYEFYDGIIKGQTGAIAIATSSGSYNPPTESADINGTKISAIETNAIKVSEVDGNYQVLYLALDTNGDYIINLDSRGGTVSDNYLTVTPGHAINGLPTPGKGIYTFEGWYDEATDELVTDLTVPDGDMDLYAKWSYTVNPNVVEFRTTPDAQKVYYQNIATWKLDETNFPKWNYDTSNPPVMVQNFNTNNCMCADGQCSTGGTVHCDKPKGYNTGAGGAVNVYTYDTVNEEKDTLVTYAKGSNGTIYNLIPDKVYYWELASDTSVHGLVRFTSERRLIDAGDVLNVRDLGGLPVDTDGNGTIDGHLAYGRLFRGIKLNSNASVTELTNLGITKELDIREANNESYRLSNYQNIEIQNYYINPNTESAQELEYYNWTRSAVKQVMLDITNQNSPQNIYFHCRIGSDRTGTLAYILEGLLGVPEEDRVQDYELSFFYGVVKIHRYHDEKPGSSVGTGKERFVYMHNFMPTNDKIYEWYMAGTTEEERQNDINLINAFRTAMIE